MQPMISFEMLPAVSSHGTKLRRPQFDRIPQVACARQCSYLSASPARRRSFLLYFYGTVLISVLRLELPVLMAQAKLYLLFTAPLYFFLASCVSQRYAAGHGRCHRSPDEQHLNSLSAAALPHYGLPGIGAKARGAAAVPDLLIAACGFTTACYFISAAAC